MIKSERGSITVFTLSACLLMIFILVGIFMGNQNKVVNQKKQLQIIEENYNSDIENKMAEKYEEILGKVEPLTEGNTTFTYNPSGWTNGNVTVTVSTDVKKYKIQTSKDGKNWDNTATQEYSENGKIYARLSNGKNYGRMIEKPVSNIDKLPPKDFVPTATSTTKSITVTASADDADETDEYGKSGMAGYRFSKDNGNTWTSYQTSGEYTWDGLTQSTDYTIKVEARDNAGNTKQGNVSKGTGTVETATGGSYTPTTWTNGNVTVTLPTKSGFTTRYTTDGTKPTKDSTQYESTFTVNSNCTITYLYTDGTNIGGTGTLNITNIDKLEPNAFTPTATSTTNSITVTASTTDANAANGSGKSGIAGYRFSKDNGSTWTSYQTSGTYTWNGLTQSTDYTILVEAKDNAGNTKQEVAVTNEYNVSTADQVLCTIGGRNFCKYNSEVAVAGVAYYINSSNWMAPILVSTLPDAVSYYTTYNNQTLKTSGNLQYNGRTYYYSSYGQWMHDDANYTASVKLINTTSNRFDSVKSAAEAILKKYYTIRTKTVTALTSANVTFTYNPSGWTSGSVKVTAALKDMTSSYTLKITDSNPVGANTSTALRWANASTGITVSSNKTVYAVLVDSTGQTGTAATGSVTNIDTAVPVINTALSGTGTTNSIKLSMAVSDTQSGVKKIIWYYKLSTNSSYTSATDNYTATTSKTTRTHTFTGLTQGKTYNAYAVVYDAVGRTKTSSTINVNTGRVTDANVTFTYNPSGWTSGSVKVTAALKDMTSSYTLKITDSNPVGANTSTALRWANASTGITVSSNKTVYAVLVDSTGQTGAAATGNVTKIDKSPPSATISLSSRSTYTDQTVTATVTHTDTGTSGVNISKCKWIYNTSSTAIGTSSSDWNNPGGTFSSNGQRITLSKTASGTYYLHVLTTDNAGNVKETISSSVTVTKVLSLASQVSVGDYVSYNATNGSIGYTSPKVNIVSSQGVVGRKWIE